MSKNMFRQDGDKRPQLSTGAVIFDTLNGKKEKYSDGTTKIVLGLTSTKIVSFTGPMSTGKTSMAIDLAYDAIQPYENGHIYIMDYEHAFEPIRVQQLTGLYIDQIADRFTLVEFVGKKDLFDEEKEPITVTSIGKLVRQIYDFKMKHKAELSTIIDGIATLEPTIIIVDSIAATITDKQKEEGDSNNMTGATRAKDLGETFNILNPLLGPANITMFLINHLHEDVQTGTPKAAILRDLKQGETMPGGKNLNYLIGTNVILRRGPKLNEDKEYGIDGMYINMMLAKSRGAATGKMRELIFVPEKGFLWDLSLFDYLVENKKLEGGNKFSIPGYDKQKVSRKAAVGLCENDKEFVQALRDYGTKVLVELIPEALTRPLTREEEEAEEAKILASFVDDIAKSE